MILIIDVSLSLSSSPFLSRINKNIFLKGERNDEESVHNADDI